MKRNVFIILGRRQCVLERTRRRRELHLIRRVLFLVCILFITGFPYASYFFVINIGHLPLLRYGHRISFMFITFGQGIVTLFAITKDY
jgi:hypothetical protein